KELAPGVLLPLQALEVAEGGAGRLVEQARQGPRRPGLGEQRGVAAQHHGLVLHLVPVDPGEELGAPGVGGAVGDAAQQVDVARAWRAGRRSLALGPGSWLCPGAPLPPARTCSCARAASRLCKGESGG
uniref:Uncharacterized protein n=1 Tax=Gopherus agassizii TaxID=38772 RepID=A0A452I1N3_9SAUR